MSYILHAQSFAGVWYHCSNTVPHRTKKFKEQPFVLKALTLLYHPVKGIDNFKYNIMIEYCLYLMVS